MREALADFAAQRGQGVFAPRVLTPDALLSASSDHAPAVASRLDSRLAWIAVLREPTFAAVEALARCPDFLAHLWSHAQGKFSIAAWLDGLDQLHARPLPGG